MLRKSVFLDIVSSLMKEENSNLSATLHTCSPATEVSVPDCVTIGYGKPMLAKNVGPKQKRWLEMGALNWVEVALFCGKNRCDCWPEGKGIGKKSIYFLTWSYGEE